MTQNPFIFNRARVRQHRDRAARTLPDSDFMLRAGAERLAERLPDIKRGFPMALDLGAHHGALAEYVPASCGIDYWVQSDLSQRMVGYAQGLKVVADEEFLPFRDASFDLVVSVFSLHWINDLPGSLIQINRVLKPGGLMMAMLPGGETLKELRQSFEQAELAVTGGISPHVSPFIDARDGANLLQRTGFIEPVADNEIVNIHYENPMKLLHDLRNGGETNSLITSAKAGLRRKVFYEMINYYQNNFAYAGGRVNATCEIVTLTGWKKDA